MVVFFDIDGTIVENESQVIPESAVRAIAALRRNGHLAVVNTGRPYSHIDPRIRAMDFGAYICACGMEILLEDTWISRCRPDDALCRLTRDTARECDMQIAYEGEDSAIYLDGHWSTHPTAIKESGIMRQKGFRVEELNDLPQPRFLKFVTYSCEESRKEEFFRRMAPYYEIIERITLQEYVLKGCSKAGGMLELLSSLGVGREDTLAIGDSTNDLPMFEAAAHTACMGDGMDALKEKAEYITAPVLEDGIEKALKHFCLI